MKPPLADDVVDALIAAHLVDPVARQESIDVVAGVLASPEIASGTPRAAQASVQVPVRRNLPQLVEVVAYLGGALVLAAGGLFLLQQWDDLGFGARVALLAVVTVVLAVSGSVSAKVPAGGPSLDDESQDSRRRLAGALLTGSALAAAFLVGHVVDEVMDTTHQEIYWPAVVGAAAGVLAAALGYRIVRTAVGVVALMGGILTVAGNLLSGIDTAGTEGDTAGAVFFLIGVVWLALTELRLFREVTIARTLGVGVALVGAQIPAIDGTHAWLGYALTVLVAVVGIAIYLKMVAWPYLAGAVIAVTLVVPEAVSDWTDGSLGAVGGVLVAGVTLLVASFAGYRVRAGAND